MKSGLKVHSNDAFKLPEIGYVLSSSFCFSPFKMRPHVHIPSSCSKIYNSFVLSSCQQSYPPDERKAHGSPAQVSRVELKIKELLSI